MANPLASLYGFAARKILRPDGSYGDSPDYSQPMGSDTNGWTGRGELTDTPDPSTVDSNSNSYSDSPPPIKPTESEASPTTARLNPSMSMGDRIPGGPAGYTLQSQATIPFPQTRDSDGRDRATIPFPQSDGGIGGGGGAGAVRPLSEGMAAPAEYTERQNALHDSALHPKTSAWRQVLAGLAGGAASGILSPLGDTIRYGGAGATAHHDAINRLRVADEAWNAKLALDKEQGQLANQAMLRKQAQDQLEANTFNRNQTLEERKFNQGQQRSMDWNKMYGPGGSAMAESVPDASDINLSLPSQYPSSSIGPTPPATAQSIPSRPAPIYSPTVSGESLTSQGFHGAIPPRYSTVLPPRAPQWSASGEKVEMGPQGPPVMVPPRDMAEQKRAAMQQDAKQANWPTVGQLRSYAENLGVSLPKASEHSDVDGMKIDPDLAKSLITAAKEGKEGQWDVIRKAVGGDPQAKAMLAMDTQQKVAARPVTNNVQLTPEAIEQNAKRYNETGVLPTLGMGAAGAPARTQILNKAAEKGGDIATNAQEYKATTATLSNLQKLHDNVLAFERTANLNADLALTASKDVDRTGSPLWNRAALAFKSGVWPGDPKVQAFKVAVQTFANEYAKVMTNNGSSGVVSDSARKEMADLFSMSQNPQQFEAGVRQAQKDMANRRAGLAGQLGEIRGRRGKTGSGEGSGVEGGTTKPPLSSFEH